MSIIETIILGIIQGIAEFLPISSSAHLIIFRDIFGIGSSMPQDMALSFDIALHFGAQEVCDLMVENGIEAIWNFAPCKLSVPEHVVFLQENLALSLAYLKQNLSLA